MKIFLAGDHAGFEMKKELAAFVKGLRYEAEDLGPFSYDAEDDYTDYVIPLAREVARVDKSYWSNKSYQTDKSNVSDKPYQSDRPDSPARGIVAAGSGQGEIIAMNRVPGARAALFCPCNLELLKASRGHNDSNILAIGARFCTVDEAKTAVKLWLETPFSGDERHIRRLRKIEELYNAH